jgi:hypothetical protein
MRYFNTSGPCDPREHYTVLRQELIAKGLDRVRRGRYLTIFAPRQSGKTTFFKLLLEALRQEGRLTPLQLSFENLKKATQKKFYRTLTSDLRDKLAKIGIELPEAIEDELDLAEFFKSLHRQGHAFALVIDEFEGVPEAVLSELMHTFRKIYHERQDYALHSLMLVGVSTMAELIVSHASPFNIVDELKISYFSFDEVRELIGQYTSESGQPFEEEVIRAIYHNTNGQPGLVCALCAHLVEEIATDRSRPVTMDDFYKTLQHFLTERFDKNIINIVQKAKRKKSFMLRMLFSGEPIPFTVHETDIGYLYANGVVENVNGQVDIDVPLYKKALLKALRPTINGESEYYVSAHDTFGEYTAGGELNLNAILQKYTEYVTQRGFRAFDTDHLKEGAWHYSLDGFINFFIERLGGRTFVEAPSGRGRTDIMILWRNQKYIIETKIFSDHSYFENGKRQLAAYLKTEGLDAGHYVVFSKKHTEADVLEQEEEIEGRRIHTRIIRVNFDRPSRPKKKRK